MPCKHKIMHTVKKMLGSEKVYDTVIATHLAKLTNMYM